MVIGAISCGEDGGGGASEGGGTGGRVVSSLTETWEFFSFLQPVRRLRKGRDLPPESALARPSVVVFDMGGVLIDYNPRHLYRKLIPDEAEMEDFLARVTTREWHTRQDYDGDPATATRELQALHPGKEALISAYYDRFDEMLAHTFEPMTAL
eukprot:gene10258-13016_t